MDSAKKDPCRLVRLLVLLLIAAEPSVVQHYDVALQIMWNSENNVSFSIFGFQPNIVRVFPCAAHAHCCLPNFKDSRPSVVIGKCSQPMKRGPHHQRFRNGW